MSKITIPFHSWGQNCMEKCVHLSLYVVYLRCYATVYIIFRILGFLSGAAKGYKLSLLDIISAWYLADSENRHFKD